MGTDETIRILTNMVIDRTKKLWGRVAKFFAVPETNHLETIATHLDNIVYLLARETRHR